jgi:hypothetical protein
MAGNSRPPDVPDSLSREIDLAAALAREQVLETHLRFLIEFVERARGDIPPPRVLSIYQRLHHLAPSDGLLLAHRLMVVIGQRESEEPADIQPPMDADREQVPWNGPGTLFRRISRRLRGRVNPGLRDWVELHTGRAEIAVLEVHVENAARFIEILGPDTPYAASIELYANLMHIPVSRVETLYLLALDRVARARAATPDATAAPQPADSVVALRVMENRG